MVEEPQRDLTFPGRRDSGRKREDEPKIASTSLRELQKRKKLAPTNFFTQKNLRQKMAQNIT